MAREGATGAPGGGEQGAQGSLELGELEQLTISNDNDLAYDQITTPKEAFRKTWSAKYTLRSHFDGVRCLGFHPSEPVLITASEDQTLKMWNLQKTITTKKSTNLDVEVKLMAEHSMEWVGSAYTRIGTVQILHTTH